MSANKMGEHKDEGMEVEDGTGVLDAVVAKSLDIYIRALGGVEGSGGAFKIAETDTVATKNLDVSVGGLESTFKIAKTDIIIAMSSDILVRGLGNIKSLRDTTKIAMMVTKK